MFVSLYVSLSQALEHSHDPYEAGASGDPHTLLGLLLDRVRPAGLHLVSLYPIVSTSGEGSPMPPTDTAPATLSLDPHAFLEQHAAILLDAPDNETMLRRLLAAALRRVSALEQQLAALTPPAQPRQPVSFRPAILALLREQPAGLTRPQIEEALARQGLGETLRRMVRDALLVRTEDRYRLASAASEAPPPAPRQRGSRPRPQRRA